MTVFGWSLGKVLGFCICGVLLPGFLIWRLETGDNPDRSLGFFWGGWVIGGFTKILYELIRARGAYRLLAYDERRSKHLPWFLPLTILVALFGWFGQSGEPWRWVYPLLPIAIWASALRAPRSTLPGQDAAPGLGRRTPDSDRLRGEGPAR